MVFGAILIVRIGVEDGENKKSFTLFLTLDIMLSEEEEESNDDT